MGPNSLVLFLNSQMDKTMIGDATIKVFLPKSEIMNTWFKVVELIAIFSKYQRVTFTIKLSDGFEI